MKKRKWLRDLQVYNLVISNIWLLLTTMLVGAIIGYLLDRRQEGSNRFLLLFSVIFFLIGIINFFVAIIRGSQKLNEQKAATARDEADEDIARRD